MVTSTAMGHGQAGWVRMPERIARSCSASKGSTNAQTAGSTVVASAHQWLAEPCSPVRPCSDTPGCCEARARVGGAGSVWYWLFPAACALAVCWGEVATSDGFEQVVYQGVEAAFGCGRGDSTAGEAAETQVVFGVGERGFGDVTVLHRLDRGRIRRWRPCGGVLARGQSKVSGLANRDQPVRLST